MPERPCDLCHRPLWDGGHALNERECSEPGGEKCRLYAENRQLKQKVVELEHKLGCSDWRCPTCNPKQVKPFPVCAMCGGNRDTCGHFVGHGAM